MGVDKATLEIRGETLFERQLNVFREVFPRILIAGDRPDLARSDVPAIPDQFPGSALGGLYTGLSNAGTSYIFAAPCDMPFPDADLVWFIVSHREAKYDAVVPRTGAGAEPLFALYSSSCLEAMQDLLKKGSFRILDLYERVNVFFLEESTLPVGYERALLNINTQADLERARRELNYD